MKKQTKPAIAVTNLSKTFLVPHQKIDSVRGLFVNLFAKKSFEKFNALSDVNFEIGKGEFVGILGHNGSGKSTLLKCLANVYTADRGCVKINGEISPFLELGIGFNPELSGRDNIYLNATILGMSPGEIDNKFDEIVAFSEIGDFIDGQVKNYSSGMKGRLAFAVSIHANRDILLMDEVLAVGDSRFQKKCLDHFETYKKNGKTVVLVTHNMGAVRQHCDRAILLHRGKIDMVGNPDEVADRYIEVNMTEDEKQNQLEKEREEERARLHRKEQELKLQEKRRSQDLGVRQKNEEKKKREQALKKYREDSERKRKEERDAQAALTSHMQSRDQVTIDAVTVSGSKEDRVAMSEYMRGDRVVVHILFKNPHNVENLIFGISLYKDDVVVSGFNTLWDEFDTGTHSGGGYIACELPSIHLPAGLYRVKVSAADHERKVFYDIYDNMSASFHIKGKQRKYVGDEDVIHKWF